MGRVLLEILYIIARLLFIMLLLGLIGKPLWFLFSKVFGSSMKLDFVQELVVDVCLGGFILYILALIPLQLFSHSVLLVILIFCASFSTYLIVDSKIKRYKKRKFLIRKSDLVDQIPTLSLFLIALLIQCILLNNFIFGSIHDTSLHALFTELVIENRMIPETHQPYMAAAIIFPQGATPIFAFASLMVGMIPPLAVFHVTSLFNAITVLAVYHYGKEYMKFKWGGLSLAFMVALVSMWPAFITWGGNTFVMAFSYFLVALTMVKWTQNIQRFTKWRQCSVLIVVGVFIGYLATVHLSFFWLLMLTWGIHEIAKHRITLRILQEQIGKIFFLLFAIGIVGLPFYIRFVRYYSLPGHNIGLPTDIGNVIETPLPIGPPPVMFADVVNFLLTMFSQVNISPYGIPRVIFIGLSMVGVLLVFSFTLKHQVVSECESLLVIMIGVNILLILLQVLIPETVVLGRYMRFTLLIYFSFILLIGSLNFRIYKKWKLFILKIKPSFNSKKLVSLIVLLMIFVPIYAPFVYYRLAEDPQLIMDNCGLFAVTSKDDYDLMIWMKNNLPINTTVLVNPFEPGLFIPSISHKKIVYPLSGYHLSQSYAQVVDLLANGVLNQTVYQYLLDQNITHVYVGSKKSALAHADFNQTKWDPYLFLGNPNFDLTKRFGTAYLFRFLYTNPQLIFVDSFEGPDLSSKGWNLAPRNASESSETNGCHIVAEHSFEGEHSAKITTKSSGIPQWTSIVRQIYTPQPVNISISFYLKPIRGFGPQDDLMFIVSDDSWKNQIYFRTQNLPVKSNPVFLSKSGGYFEFDLSELWQSFYNQSLPKTFFIQVLNYDSDGNENIAHIDTVAVGYNVGHFFSNHSAFLRDEFECFGPSLDGWGFHAMKGESNGFGSAEITDLYAHCGQHSLVIKAQTTAHQYWCSVIKTVNLYWNASNVTLSLYASQVKGFGDSDAFMIIISDQTWKKQIYLTTNRMIPIPPTSLLIPTCEGYLKFNLVQIWRTMFDGDFPDTFFVQIVNYDSDGIENIVYVDEVEIRIS